MADPIHPFTAYRVQIIPYEPNQRKKLSLPPDDKRVQPENSSGIKHFENSRYPCQEADSTPPHLQFPVSCLQFPILGWNSTCCRPSPCPKTLCGASLIQQVLARASNSNPLNAFGMKLPSSDWSVIYHPGRDFGPYAWGMDSVGNGCCMIGCALCCGLGMGCGDNGWTDRSTR